MKYDFISHNML